MVNQKAMNNYTVVQIEDMDNSSQNEKLMVRIKMNFQIKDFIQLSVTRKRSSNLLDPNQNKSYNFRNTPSQRSYSSTKDTLFGLIDPKYQLSKLSSKCLKSEGQRNMHSIVYE